MFECAGNRSCGGIRDPAEEIAKIRFGLNEAITELGHLKKEVALKQISDTRLLELSDRSQQHEELLRALQEAQSSMSMLGKESVTVTREISATPHVAEGIEDMKKRLDELEAACLEGHRWIKEVDSLRLKNEATSLELQDIKARLPPNGLTSTSDTLATPSGNAGPSPMATSTNGDEVDLDRLLVSRSSDAFQAIHQAIADLRSMCQGANARSDEMEKQLKEVRQNGPPRTSVEGDIAEKPVASDVTPGEDNQEVREQDFQQEHVQSEKMTSQVTKHLQAYSMIVQMATRVLDRYGLTQATGVGYSAGMGPKTMTGAAVSVFFAIIVIILVVIQIRNFVDPNNYSVGLGEDTTISNSLDPGEWFGKVGDTAADAKYANFMSKGDQVTQSLPTLTAEFTVDVLFYDDYPPGSIQKLEIVDNTGYEPYFTSSETKVQHGSSLVQEIAIPLGSFDEQLQRFDTPRAAKKFDMRQLLAVQATHATLAEPLKTLYEMDGIFASQQTFFPHDAHLFVRLDAPAMKRVKSGQLQVYLYNKGIQGALAAENPDVLKDRRYHNSHWFTTLATSNVTYGSKSFPKTAGGKQWRYELNTADRTYAKVGYDEKLEILHIQSSLNQTEKEAFEASESWGPLGVNISRSPPSQLDLTSWVFGVNYVNNFVYTHETAQCDSDSSESWYNYGISFMEMGSNATIFEINCTDGTFKTDGEESEDEDEDEDEEVNWDAYVIRTKIKWTDCALYQGFERKNMSFYALIHSVWGTERGLFRYEAGFLHRLDTAYIDHTKTPPKHWSYDGGTNWDYYVEGEPPWFPTKEWRCNPLDYWEDGICQCECGLYDPDCGYTFDSMGLDIQNCRDGEYCSLASTCMKVNPAKNIFVADDD